MIITITSITTHMYNILCVRTLEIYSLGNYSHHAALYPRELFILQLEVHTFQPPSPHFAHSPLPAYGNCQSILCFSEIILFFWFGVFCLVGWLVEFLFIQIQHISEQATFLSMHFLEVVRSKVVPPL